MLEPLTEAYEAPREADLSVAERSGSATAMATARSQYGRFTILKAHAQGGLGRVCIARDEKLRRHVALKEIRPDRLANVSLRQRFLTEAEITGQLEHPGIVPIYTLDEDANGQPYYAMRFVAGRTLAETMAAYHRQPTALAFRDLLKRFVDVCQTIAFAHSKGVIHRDLKPANVLLREYGETLVLDWGLAKRILVDVGSEPRPLADAEDCPPTVGAPLETSADGLTEAGQVLGTPAYMSPEQAEGQSAGVRPATDIYSLGAILYELLTGRPPYQGKNAAEVLAQVRTAMPPAPSVFRRALPPALEAICLKAMARHAADRYPAATDLARDVERWLADEPVQAYREPVTERLWRWARRRRNSLIAYGVSGFIALITLTAAGWIISIESAKANVARRAREIISEDVTINAGELRRANDRYRQLDGAAVKSLDRMEQVAQNPLFNRPEFQRLRNELLELSLEFSDEAIRINQGRDDYHRLRRALCLARMREHKRAFDEATKLSEDKYASTEIIYGLARVSALCAAAADADGCSRSGIMYYAAKRVEARLAA